jgi:hypothetical protein
LVVVWVTVVTDVVTDVTVVGEGASVVVGAAGRTEAAGAPDSGVDGAGLEAGVPSGVGVGDDGGVGSPGVSGALLSVGLVGAVGVVGDVEVVGVVEVEVVVVVAGLCRCTSVRGAQV